MRIFPHEIFNFNLYYKYLVLKNKFYLLRSMENGIELELLLPDNEFIFGPRINVFITSQNF